MQKGWDDAPHLSDKVKTELLASFPAHLGGNPDQLMLAGQMRHRREGQPLDDPLDFGARRHHQAHPMASNRPDSAMPTNMPMAKPDVIPLRKALDTFLSRISDNLEVLSGKSLPWRSDAQMRRVWWLQWGLAGRGQRGWDHAKPSK